MKKILLAGLFVLFASQVKAQVTAVTILGAGSGGPGQSVPVTFVITNTNLFYNVTYDILFSPSSSVTNTAYSSALKGPMVCSGADYGYSYASGTSATTIIQNVTVPGYQYSGYVVVIAGELPTSNPYLTCSSTSGNVAFSMVPTPTVTATNTSTSTATSTSTSTNTNTITNTPTITQTPTITATNTATATATKTATKTATTTATQTPTVTSTFTSTKTPTAFFTYTVTLTPIATNTPFYPQILANQQVQVTATGTPGGQLVWIPEPAGWGGGGGGGGSSATPNATVQSNAPFQLTQIAQFNALQTQVAALQTVVNVQPIGTQTPTATPNATQVPAMIATLTTQMNILLTEVPVPTNSAPPPALATPTNTPSIATFALNSLTPVVVIPTVTGKKVYVEGVEAFGTSSNAYSNLSFTTQLTPIEGPVGMNAGASALLLDPSSNVIRFIGNSSGDLSVTESAAATFNGRVFYWQQ